MVRFVSQRPPPEDPLFEILVRRWQSKRGYEKVGKPARPAWWRVNFPVYMELAYLFSNVVFVLGSVLFLPMHQEDEAIHSLGMTLDTVDKSQLLAASTHFQSLVDSLCDLHNVLAAKAPLPDPGSGVSIGVVTPVDELSEAAAPTSDHNASNSSARRPGGVHAPPYDSLGNSSEASPLIRDGNTSNSSIRAVNGTRPPPSDGPKNSSKVPGKTEPRRTERRLLMDHQIARPTNPRDGCPLRVEEVQEQVASMGKFSSNAFVVAFEAPQVMAKRQRLDWRVDLGCYFFILGSLVVALLCLYDLLEEILQSYGQSADEDEQLGAGPLGQPSPSSAASPIAMSPMSPTRAQSRPDVHISENKQACGEKLLYLVGSVVFLVGTLYWQHPEKLSSQLDSMDDQDVIVMAIFMFILGSVVFTFAAFLNALSLTTGLVRFRSWAVATCGVYEFGGILFVMGSVCFMPGCTEKMEYLGAVSFIVGSLFYVTGSLFQLSKTTALLYLRLEEEIKEDAARTIQLWWKSLPKEQQAMRVRTQLRQAVTRRMQQERINAHIAKGRDSLVATLHKAIETPQFLDHFNRQTSPRGSIASGLARQGSLDSAPGQRSAAGSRRPSKNSLQVPPEREELAGASRRRSKSSAQTPPAVESTKRSRSLSAQ